MNEAREATHWGPGLIVLGLGLLAGALFLLWQWRKSRAAPPGKASENTLANLEQRVRLLIEQLKELQADRHQLGEERFKAENSRLELEAAAAMRARDEFAQGKVASAASAPSAPANAAPVARAAQTWSQRNPQMVGALWGGGAVGFFVILGLVLSGEEKPKQEMNAGGAPMQQQAPPSRFQPPPSEPKELQDAMTRLADHPEDLELADQVGHELIRIQRFDDAERITEQTLGFDPFNIEARIHRAVLKMPKGQSQQAVEELQHLAQTYPHTEEARLFLGGLRMDIGDRAGALDAFQRYVADAPPQEIPPQLPAMMQQLKASLPARP